MSRSQQSSVPKYYFPTSTSDPKPTWRIRINQTQLVSQTCSIILQRHTKLWAPLLKSLKPSSNFTPSIFHQILAKIHAHPEICLRFFNWAKKNLDFKPDLKAQCQLTRILLGSGPELSKCGYPILNSIVQDYPPAKFVPLLIQPGKSGNTLNISPVLNSVVECYCSNDMYLHSLEVCQMAKQYRAVLTVSSCNAMLKLFADKNELKLAWSFYASMIRNGVSEDELTWCLIAKLLCNEGKFARVTTILDVEMYSSGMFDLIIECYSKRGNFQAALIYLNKMCSKGFDPSFVTYSSILDGACKYENKEVIENVMGIMIQKGFLSDSLDSIIHKLCDLGNIYAMDLFFKRACNEKIELLHSTYESVLSTLLSEEGRLKDAIELYDIMQENNVVVNEKCDNKFVIALCNENPSQQVSKLLFGIIKRGFSSALMEISKYVTKLCAKGPWREAEELLNLIMDRGYLLDSLCYGYFVRRYCSSRQIYSAITLHDKLAELKGTLDASTYNVFLAALLKEKRIEEAMKIFDYMKRCEVLSSENFSLMIRGLCHEKEMRKAMKLHDEMLELGLKPDPRSYKRLISHFK